MMIFSMTISLRFPFEREDFGTRRQNYANIFLEGGSGIKSHSFHRKQKYWRSIVYSTKTYQMLP